MDTQQGAPEPQQGAGGQPSDTQSVNADIKKVADSAKAATQGFDFNKLFVGRLDEKNFMYFAIIAFVIDLILMRVGIIGTIISLALGVLGLGATARRMHDIGVTGWAALIMFVPLVNLIAVIYLCIKHGDATPNAYGAIPDKNRDLFKAILNT